MKLLRIIVILLLLRPDISNCQIITTYVSGGLIYCAEQIAFDKKGNLYIPSGLGHYVIKIDTTGNITKFAGTGTHGYSGDGGQATSAELYNPEGIAVDTIGNVYIAEEANNRIRKVDVSTGIINTIAGNGYGAPISGGYSGDGGQATAAELYLPNGLYFDKNENLYITDNGNFRVRKINTAGIITTVVGNGIMGSSGDGGPATAAECGASYCMCMDAFDNFYVIDGISYTIRKVNTSGIISTIAGKSGYYHFAGDNVPALGANIAPESIAFDDNGQLYISDWINNRVRMVDRDGIIHTIAGTGVAGNSGDGGGADLAQISQSTGVAFDHCGNLFIAQVSESSIRKVSLNPYCIPVEVNSVINQRNIKIYPNPTYDQLNINNVKFQATYDIQNLIGTTMQQGILNEGNNSISLQSLPEGMYILELIDEQKNRTVHKIVKQ